MRKHIGLLTLKFHKVTLKLYTKNLIKGSSTRYCGTRLWLLKHVLSAMIRYYLSSKLLFRAIQFCTRFKVSEGGVCISGGKINEYFIARRRP